MGSSHWAFRGIQWVTEASPCPVPCVTDGDPAAHPVRWALTCAPSRVSSFCCRGEGREERHIRDRVLPSQPAPTGEGTSGWTEPDPSGSQILPGAVPCSSQLLPSMDWARSHQCVQLGWLMACPTALCACAHVCACCTTSTCRCSAPLEGARLGVHCPPKWGDLPHQSLGKG